MFGNFSLFKTPFPERSSIPTSFVSFFAFYIFSYLLSKTMSCFSGCLMSSAVIQKLFCGIYSVFKCSFDEFVGEKVVFPSYSSAILGSPQDFKFNQVPLVYFCFYVHYYRRCVTEDLALIYVIECSAMFSIMHLIISGFPFRSLIHFDFLFV